jgi:hypothetical protein
MKTEPRFSKSVVLIAILALALAGAVLWLNRRAPEKISAPPVASVVAKNSNAPVARTLFTPRAVSPPPKNSIVTNADDSLALIPIPLTNVLIAAENGSWLRDKDYLAAPHQPQEFGGVTFLMDGMIQLQGKMSKEWKNRSYRTAVTLPLALTNFSAGGSEIIQHGSKIASLYLLGATRYGSNEEKTFAEIVWHYTDGTSARTPVQYFMHFRDWVRNPYEEPAHLPYAFTKVVWTMPQPSQPSHALRLYRCGFGNPAPNKIIRELEFVSAMEDPTLVIVGVTLDPLALGQRPDSSPDLEPTDANPPKSIDIFVQSADGQAVRQAKLDTQFDQMVGPKNVRTSGFLKTDANGFARVNYPPQDLEQLSIGAEHDDFSGQKMVWDVKAGDTVPASYTLKLSAEVKIGGIVVDESEQPISGADIRLYRFWSGDDGSPNKKGEQPSFSTKGTTTDASGRWQAKGLPPTLLDHIGFEVKHPDFLGTNFTVGRGGIEESLRAGTFKTVLHRGLEAFGRVVDESDNPIAGATVWAGLRNYRERQETKTGGEGKFRFKNVTGGDVVFSVSAKGRQPDSKTVSVKADMAEIIFKLPAGKTIRAVVQDENASPIPGARVVLEGSGDMGRTYEFSTTTDKDGRFEWDSAPDGPAQFYIGKDGYEQKRNVELKPDIENIVTLRKPRTVQGQVVDAESGNPVTKFRVGVGRYTAGDSFYADYPGMKDFTDVNGRFSVTLDEEYDTGVKAEADDYSEKIELLPDAQNGVMTVTLRLKPSAALHGVVVSPQGQPLPDVSVALTKNSPGGTVSLSGTRLRSYSSGPRISITDADGKFTLPSPPETGGIVLAVGDPGYSTASVEQLRANPTLVLQPWGRIEGTLKIGGQPGAGKDLMLTLGDIGVGTDWDSYKRTTDEQGAFTFEKVPPGEVSIARLIKTSENSWSHSDSTPVTVKPGETTPVTLGDNGAVVVGKVRFETPATNGEALSIEGNLSSQMPQQRPNFNSQEEAQAFYNSPEWKELMKSHKNYSLEIKSDGSFEADNVVPGNYSLNVSARPGGSRPWEHPPVAQGNIQVTVPDSFSAGTPINIGEVLLRATLQ